MKRSVFTLVAIILLGLSAQAAKYAGDAFSLGVGARPLAMGGGTVAGPFDATASYWNPAGMNYLAGRQFAAMHAETFGSLLNHDYLGYIHNRGETASIIKSYGFYIYYLGGGGIKITEYDPATQRAYVLREESHGDYLFAAAVAGKIACKVDFGLTAKIIYRDIGTESGKGLTLDAGLLYQANSRVRFGLMVTDITSGFIRYSGKTFDGGANIESIYPTVKPGLLFEHHHYDITGRVAVSGDLKFENLGEVAQYSTGSLSLDTHFGAEIGYLGIVFGRFGFDMGRFTAGGGINVQNITVDFAYLHHSELDETFRVSAGYRW